MAAKFYWPKSSVCRANLRRLDDEASCTRARVRKSEVKSDLKSEGPRGDFHHEHPVGVAHERRRRPGRRVTPNQHKYYVSSLSRVRARMPCTRRSIATRFSAPRGTTTSANCFVGRTNSSKAGLTNLSYWGSVAGFPAASVLRVGNLQQPGSPAAPARRRVWYRPIRWKRQKDFQVGNPT